MSIDPLGIVAEDGELEIVASYPQTCNVTFHDGEGEIGRLDWTDGEMVFSGDLTESAQVFFSVLKSMVDAYIDQQIKGERES